MCTMSLVTAEVKCVLSCSGRKLLGERPVSESACLQARYESAHNRSPQAMGHIYLPESISRPRPNTAASLPGVDPLCGAERSDLMSNRLRGQPFFRMVR